MDWFNLGLKIIVYNRPIRIYTLTGELVDIIEKDDNGSIAYWNLLSSEGMRISYGVYIFHVNVPGIGEKIGRFGIIK